MQKTNDPDEITVITIRKTGDVVEADVTPVDGYEMIDPQAMIGACANIIAEMNQFVFSSPKDDNLNIVGEA